MEPHQTQINSPKYQKLRGKANRIKTVVGIYQISICTNADRAAFEEIMKTKFPPKVGMRNQTWGGIVMSQYLLKNEASDFEYDYAQVVRWENQGGSPFGAMNAPPDPAQQLAAFGAKTSFTQYAFTGEKPQ